MSCLPHGPSDTYSYFLVRWWVKDTPPPTPDDFHKQATEVRVRGRLRARMCMCMTGYGWSGRVRCQPCRHREGGQDW